MVQQYVWCSRVLCRVVWYGMVFCGTYDDCMARYGVPQAAAGYSYHTAATLVSSAVDTRVCCIHVDSKVGHAPYAHHTQTRDCCRYTQRSPSPDRVCLFTQRNVQIHSATVCLGLTDLRALSMKRAQCLQSLERSIIRKEVRQKISTDALGVTSNRFVQKRKRREKKKILRNRLLFLTVS